MNKVRVGVIGAGFIGKVHIEQLRRLGYIQQHWPTTDHHRQHHYHSFVGTPQPFRLLLAFDRKPMAPTAASWAPVS